MLDWAYENKPALGTPPDVGGGKGSGDSAQGSSKFPSAALREICQEACRQRRRAVC